MRASTLAMLSEICGLLNVPSFSFKKQLTVGCIWVCQAQSFLIKCAHHQRATSQLYVTDRRLPRKQDPKQMDGLTSSPVYLPENPLKASEWVRSVYFVSQLLYFASVFVFLSNCKLKHTHTHTHTHTCFPAPSLNCSRWLERQYAFALFCLWWQ